MQIFVGVFWRVGIKEQWGDPKWQFLVLLVAVSLEPLDIRPKLIYEAEPSPGHFGSQPAGDVSLKPSGKLPLLYELYSNSLLAVIVLLQCCMPLLIGSEVP